MDRALEPSERVTGTGSPSRLCFHCMVLSVGYLKHFRNLTPSCIQERNGKNKSAGCWHALLHAVFSCMDVMLFIYCSVDFRHEQNRGIIRFKIVNVHLENSLENGDYKTVAQIKQSK